MVFASQEPVPKTEVTHGSPVGTKAPIRLKCYATIHLGDSGIPYPQLPSSFNIANLLLAGRYVTSDSLTWFHQHLPHPLVRKSPVSRYQLQKNIWRRRPQE